MKDMHNNIKVIRALAPAAAGTTGAANGRTSGLIDRKQSGVYYRSVEFVYGAGGSATVADTITPVVLECATSDGTFTSAAAADLLGTEAALTLATAGGQVGQVGYRGNKRYLKFKLYGTGTATALVNAEAILGHPDIAPPN